MKVAGEAPEGTPLTRTRPRAHTPTHHNPNTQLAHTHHNTHALLFQPMFCKYDPTGKHEVAGAMCS